MHAQGYFGKMQQSYINPHKSLHFVKNEKKPFTLSPVHSPTLKTMETNTKNTSSLLHPPSSHLIVDGL